MSRWRNKVVVVTGGSAGFGQKLVEAFLDVGATVVAVGRDQERLSKLVVANAANPATSANLVSEVTAAHLPREVGETERDLEAEGVGQRPSGDRGERLVGVAADVTCQADVERLFADVGARFGRLDVLVNNVGRSTRGLAVDVTPDEFQRLWELNFLSAVRCSRAANPWLRREGGHLVNIGSLAAKSATRFLGGYPATKAALGAYTQQLRLEWAEQGIHVMLVCPGPLRRDDSGARYDAEASGLPAEARRPGGGVRLKGLDPAWLARRVVRGCERREAEIVAPAKARLLFALQQLAPAWGDWVLGRMTRGGGTT